MCSSIQHLKTIINNLINERKLITKSNCDSILKLLIQNKEELYSLYCSSEKSSNNDKNLKIEKIKNNVNNIKQLLLNENSNRKN